MGNFLTLLTVQQRPKKQFSHEKIVIFTIGTSRQWFAGLGVKKEKGTKKKTWENVKNGLQDWGPSL